MERKLTPSERTQAGKFVVRLPPGVRNLIAEVARTNHRSMNAEVVARLEESLGLASSRVAEPPAAPYQATERTTAALSHDEALLLECFRRLAPQRQQALLDLLR